MTAASHTTATSIGAPTTMSLSSGYAGALVAAPREVSTKTPSERFGQKMVEIVAGPAGPNQYRVAVHKNLLINSCKEAAQTFEQCPTADIYFVGNVSKEIVDIVFNFIYGVSVPAFAYDPSSPEGIADHNKLLVKLYIFAEDQGMCNDFLNRVMDELQDTFKRHHQLPDPGMITYIYSNSKTDCKLRFFCAQTLLFVLQGLKEGSDYDKSRLSQLLQEHDGIFQDFLSAIQANTRHATDTRVRSCGKDPRCTSCHFGMDHCTDDKAGVSSCWFHRHDIFDMYMQLEDGKWVDNRIADECYNNVANARSTFRI